jgi:hypothetical protein
VGNLPLILNLSFLDGLTDVRSDALRGGGLIAVIVPFLIVFPSLIFFPVFLIFKRILVGPLVCLFQQ